MRAAPAVSVRCPSSALWRWLQVIIPALACTAVAAWLLGHAQRETWPALMLAPTVAWLTWRRIPHQAVALDWDGQNWSAQGRVGVVEVMVDLDRWMLLRLMPDAKAQGQVWMALSRHEVGAPWHALRAAVYCRRSQPTPRARPASDGRAAQPD